MFMHCETKDDAKKLYRRLAFYLHPDKGGEHDLMTLCSQAYELHCATLDIHESQGTNLPRHNSEIFDGKYQIVFEDVFFDSESLDIIKDIFEYSDKNTTFKKDYSSSVKDFLEKNGYITCSQYNSLVKIYYAFHMHEA